MAINKLHAMNLRRMRLHIDLTQREMAKAFGITSAYLCGMEKARCPITPKMAHHIIHVFKVKYHVNWNITRIGLREKKEEA